MKNVISAVVLADSADDLARLKNRLPSSFSVRFLSSLDKALLAIGNSHPDYFATMAHAGIKQGFILDKVRELSPNTACIFFTEGDSLKQDDLLEKIKNVKIVDENAYYDADEKATAARRRVNETISKLFLSLGIPPHFKGYYYLRTGITLTLEKPSLISSVTTILYPMIAERYGTTGAKVERSIRHALTVAWNKGRTKAFNKLIGIDTLTENDRPTSSEFIALVTDRLLISEILCDD